MRSLEAGDGTLYNKQHSGCHASNLETIDRKKTTNKSVRKHPSLLIYESYRAVNTAVLFILFVFRRSVVTESNYCHCTDFYVSFTET